MNIAVRLLLAGTTAFSPVLAMAEEGAESPARRIEDAISFWLPDALRSAKALEVTQGGEGGFVARLDLAAALARAIAPWEVRSVTPIVHDITMEPGGSWRFSTRGKFDLSTALPAGNRSNAAQLTIGELTDGGTFDPVLGFLRQAEISIADLQTSMRSGQDSIRGSVKRASGTVGAKDVRTGMVDLSATLSAGEMGATFGAFPNPEVRIAIETLEGTQQGSAVDIAGMRKMKAFWQKPGRSQAFGTLGTQDRKELAAIVAMHRPFIGGFSQQAQLSGVTVASGGKNLAIARLGYGYHVEDIADEAAIGFNVAMEKPTVSPGFWPDGLEKALPSEIRLSGRYSGYKMAPIWDQLSDDLDGPSGSITPQTLKVEFNDTVMRSAFYDLSLDGSIRIDVREQSTAEADFVVTARDFDRTVKFLQDNAPTVPVFGQAAFYALMAKGLGKSEADGSFVWNVRVDAEGDVSVNGQPLPLR